MDLSTPEARAVRYIVSRIDDLAVEAERMGRSGERDEAAEGRARVALLTRIHAMLLRAAHKHREGASPDDQHATHQTGTGPADPD